MQQLYLVIEQAGRDSSSPSPGSYCVERFQESAVPRNSHTQNSFPKEIPAGKWTTRQRFPFFSIPQMLCLVEADLLSSECTFEEERSSGKFGFQMRLFARHSRVIPALMYFDNLEIILGSSFVVSLRTTPWRPPRGAEGGGT